MVCVYTASVECKFILPTVLNLQNFLFWPRKKDVCTIKIMGKRTQIIKCTGTAQCIKMCIHWLVREDIYGSTFCKWTWLRQSNLTLT